MSFGAEISQMQVKNISSDYTKKKKKKFKLPKSHIIYFT